MGSEKNIINFVNSQAARLSAIAKDIWDHPQIAFQETYASELIAGELEADGFSIEWGAGGMATAFTATWGSGSPIIGFLGEYDALPGLSQQVIAEQKSIESDAPGHGCGHNLYGTACMGSVIALKREMEKENIVGTIRFYGCPAEEQVIGKVLMARDGVFDDLDAAITWHPGSTNLVWNGSSLALNSFKVNFYGVASHAAAAPHLGRSALDGVMLMDIGMNYLREHVASECRIHSVVTSGGDAPNVVPAYAQIWYYIRAPEREQVNLMYERVVDIAKGAALMSGTSHEIEFIAGCYEVLPNNALSDLMLAKMDRVNDLVFTAEERRFARQIQATFPDEAIQGAFDRLQMAVQKDTIVESIENPLWTQVLPHDEDGPSVEGSTDVGDVSWITPTGQITSCCWPLGTPPHSWQMVASSGSSIGSKGMLFATKTMALAGLDLLRDPDILNQARKEFDEARNGLTYKSALPENN